MPSLKERFLGFLKPSADTPGPAAPEPEPESPEALVPATVRRTIYDVRTSPMELASQVDLDKIIAIFRQAENGDVTELFALYRDILISDAHLQTEFGKRLLAVLGDPLAVQPADEKSADDKAAAEAVKLLPQTRGWTNALAHLMAATLWPVAVLEKVYAAGGTMGTGKLSYRLAALVPVPFELLDYRLGRLMIRVTNDAGQVTGELLEPEPSRYIVHRGHLLPTADHWGGPFRSLVFWWFFGAMDRSAWAQFIERYGSPFLVGKYDQGDDTSRGILEHAFSRAAKLFGIVISRETEVEIQQAGTKDAGEAFEAMHNVCSREKSKLILGQTSSAEAQKTGGIGDGPSEQHETVRQDIRQFDGAQLAVTLRDQLAVQFLRINGFTGSVAFAFGGEEGEQATATAALLKTLKEAGYQVADVDLPVISKRLGLTIERMAVPEPPAGGIPGLPGAPGKLEGLSLPLLALAVQALGGNTLDRMAGDGPAGLARRFRASAAPLRDIFEASESPEALLAQVRALSVGWDDAQTAALLTEALSAYTANGALRALEG